MMDNYRNRNQHNFKLATLSLALTSILFGQSVMADVHGKENLNGGSTLELGSNITASGDSTTAVGQDAVAGASNANVFGNAAEAGENASALGTSAKATAAGATAVGVKAKAKGERSIAVGNNSQAFGNYSIATGYLTKATAEDAIAHGDRAQAKGQSSIAIGGREYIKDTGQFVRDTSPVATGENSIAIGSKSKSGSLGDVAIGYGSETEGTGKMGRIAIGQSAKVTDGSTEGIAIGTRTIAKKNHSTVIGSDVSASGYGTIVIGHNTLNNENDSEGKQAVAIGSGGGTDLVAEADADFSLVLGTNAKSEKDATDGIAFGHGSNVSKAKAVALGSDSNTATDATAENNAVVPLQGGGSTTYSGFAGQATDAGMQISFGKAGAERQLKNVAAGKISATSTDAINGSQLFSIAKTLDEKIKPVEFTGLAPVTSGDKAGTVTPPTPANANKSVTAGDIANTINNIGFNVKTDGTDDGTDKLVKMGNTLEINQGDNIAIARDGKKFTIKTKKDVTFDSVKVNNAPKDGKDAVNLDYLNANKSREVVKAGAKSGLIVTHDNQKDNRVFNIALNLDEKTMKIDPNTGKLGANTTELTTEPNGKTKVPTGDDAKALATAGDVAKAINNASHKVTANNSDEQVEAKNGTKVMKAGEELTLEAGKNLNVKHEGGKFTFSTKAKVEFDKVTAKKGLTIGEGDSKIDMTPSTTKALDKDGNPSDKIPAVDMGGTTFTGVASNLPKTTSEGDAPTKTQQAPDISDEQKTNVASLGDVLNAGWNLQTAGHREDGTQRDDDVDFVKPYDTVEFVAGAGLVVDNKTDGKKSEIKFRLADSDTIKAKLKGNIGDSNDGSVVVGDPSLNDGNGFVSANNLVKAINNSGWNLENNGEHKDLVNPSNKVNFINGQGTTAKVVTADDGKSSTITYDVNADDETTQVTGTDKDGNKVVKVGDKFFTVDADGKPTSTEVAPADVAKTAISAKTGDIVENANGTVEAGENPNAVTTAKDVASAINSASHKITANNTDVQATATNGTKVMKAGEELTLEAGKNLNVQKEGGKFIFSTKAQAEFDKVKVNDDPTDGKDAVNLDYLNANKSREVVTAGKGVVVTHDNKKDNRVFNISISDKITDTIAANETIAIANQGRISANAQNIALNSQDIVKNTKGIVNNAKGIMKNAKGVAEAKAEAKKHTTVEPGKNIKIETSKNANGGLHYKVSTADKVKFKEVKVGDIVMSASTGQIHGIKAGTKPNDAVNVAQLQDLAVNFDDKLNQVSDDANAGTASAMAMAGLPQAFIEGKSMAVGATSYYNGQGAVAVGLSKISDNGRWVIKTGVSADTGGEVGGTFGAGVHF